MNYYNEHEPFCAAWLRNLIAKGLIAPGEVDERSIEDVHPDDLRKFTQCHFFAGIGIWPAALRRAGWPDDRPGWTGSCPCQPFSAAGKGNGFADERHLWPAFHHLIRECRPAIVLGEQVASRDGLAWLDLVSTDMEAEDYAFGAVDIPAGGACVDFAQSIEGAATLDWIGRAVLSCPDPGLRDALRDFAARAGAGLGYGPAHIRQRLYWVADAQCRAAERHGHSLARKEGGMQSEAREQRIRPDAGHGVATGELAVADAGRRPRVGRSGQNGIAECDATCILADGSGKGLEDAESENICGTWRGEERRAVSERRLPLACGSDWIVCTDGKARPTQPGILPLVDAWPAGGRVAILRAAGNALNLAQAAAFVRAVME